MLVRMLGRQPVSTGPGRQLSPSMQVQFGEDPFEVRLNGALGYHQRFSDLSIG